VRVFVLDTDIITLFQRRHGIVMARVATARRSNQVVVTAVTIDETYAGCHTRILRAKKDSELADAYAALSQAAAVFGTFSILPFPVPAIMRFNALVQLKLNVRKNDLRIAAIALEAGATVVTRNLRDFQRVPGMACEDWSV
jgi:tRNA(fMet)-specific endonuclease VapC